MKKLFLLASAIAFSFAVSAQKQEEAETLVSEGVTLHDKGDYEGAIKKYDKALELDKDNLLALAEKGYSLLSSGKYEESVESCKKAIEKHADSKSLKSVYVTYGNALDGMKRPDRSLEVYNEGIKIFPDYHMLYFNKGITLSGMKRNDDALLSLEKSISLNPKHPGSHNAIGRIMLMRDKNIPTLLALCRFMVLEPGTARGKENLTSIQKIMAGGAEKTGRKSVTVNVSPDMLADTTADGKPKENSFTTTDLILTFTAAMDYDKKNKNKSPAELFISKMETVCSSLKETQSKNFGFFWDYYVPYFLEMKEKNLIEPFAYIVFSSTDEKSVSKYINSHGDELKQFYEWSKNFRWKGI